MKQKEIYKKVQLLKSGVTVEISGDTFYAERIDDPFAAHPCDYCDLDCICRGDVAMVCDEMDAGTKRRWLLHLAHG